MLTKFGHMEWRDETVFPSLLLVIVLKSIKKGLHTLHFLGLAYGPLSTTALHIIVSFSAPSA